MARLRIIRGNEAFCKFSAMNVFVDDENVGQIEKHNDYRDFYVTSGNHFLRIEIGGFKSIIIEINIDSVKPTIFTVKLPSITFAPINVLINLFGGSSLIQFNPIATDYRVEKYS